MPYKILAVDDETAVLEALAVLLEPQYSVFTAQNLRQAKSILGKEKIDLVLLDLLLGRERGLDLFKFWPPEERHPQVVVLTAVKDLKLAAQSLKLGAWAYITKPFDVDELLLVIERALGHDGMCQELESLRSQLEHQGPWQELVGESPVIASIKKQLEKLAPSNLTVLILGESGTGKEVVARFLHRQSPRREKPFLAINCAAIPAELMESELFGHEAGAFTGAIKSKKGKAELAHGGTLFLDEIASLKEELQGKLLRFLQERTFYRVGGEKELAVDLRLISATNKDPASLVAQGKFRDDLYYRLKVAEIFLPPLRERRPDIPILALHFLKKFNQEMGKNIKGITPAAVASLMNRPWLGNVRELENALERAVALSTGPLIEAADLFPESFFSAGSDGAAAKTFVALKEARTAFERRYIQDIWEWCGRSLQKTSQILGVHRNTLRLKMKELGLGEE
jgi:two-component system response regulator AtoC